MFNILNIYYSVFCTISPGPYSKCKQIRDTDHANCFCPKGQFFLDFINFC